MFIDYVKISVQSGTGGNGCCSFRHEKYVPRGGPDGGDGGNGGDVVFVVDPRLNTLLDFRYQRYLRAGPGKHGSGKKMTGGRGEDVQIRIPPGTCVRDFETGEILADLSNPEERFVLFKGGRGGRGNTRFATPTNQAPERAEPGREGVERLLELELKLIADVGLVGLPNAGKSTLLSSISAAQPKIADYPFTTLRPNLGIVRFGDFDGFVVADIPGLMEGAHDGKGLGLQFLRHIERTRLLVFLVDASSPNPESDLQTLRSELHHYNPVLLDKPSIVVASKLDLLTPEARELGPDEPFELALSSATREGIQQFVNKLGGMVQLARRSEEQAPSDPL